MTNDGLSRCECCDKIVPADRLRSVTGIVPHPEIPAMLCASCNEALATLEQQFRAPMTLGHIRAAAVSAK